MSVYDAWAAVVLGGFAFLALSLWMVHSHSAWLGKRVRAHDRRIEYLEARIARHATRLNDLDDAACCTTLELQRLDARLDAIEAATRKDAFHE